MKKNLLRRVFNRWLHLLARFSPGATSLRPFLHKLRGMKIHGSVWIGEEAYIENEYPEDVEIHDGACVSMRATILAHTRGSGRIIIARNAFIGPGAMVICSSGRTLRIGEGAAVSAGAVVMSSVPAGVVIAPPRSSPVARAAIPFGIAKSVEEFMGGLEPLKRSKPKPAKPASETPFRQPES